jgi:KDO2-lipid IV(A) lauroyltransferase
MVYQLTRFVQWLAGRVPRPVRLRVAGPITVLVYYAWAAKRQVTITNMAQILDTTPGDPHARFLARLSWRNYGRYLSDFFYLPNATREEIVGRMHDEVPPPGSFALVDEALRPGKGAFLVSLHFGAWDVAAVYVASHHPIHILVESFADPRMDKLVMDQRQKVGLGILRIEKTPRQILRVLSQNGIVGVAVDKPVPPAEGVPVQFFGRTCYVPGGIAALALKSGAAILPGYCRYDPEYSATYYIGAGPVIFPESTGDKQQDVQQLTQRMFDALEAQVRRFPEQWEMFRPFWPEHESPAVLPVTDEASGEDAAALEPPSATAELEA